MSAKLVLSALFFAGSVVSGLLIWHPFRREPPTLVLPGTVEVQEVRLASRVGGRVKEVTVAEGDLVSPGRPLVTFEVPELEAKRDQMLAQIRSAVAALAKAREGARQEEKTAAREAARAAQARWQRLKTGPRSEEIEQAQADLESLEAERLHADQDLAREAALGARGANARAHLESAQMTKRRLDGLLKAARARLKMLQDGTRPEDVAEAEAEWRKAQANHDLLLAGTRAEEITEAEARVAELKAKLKELDAQLAEAVVSAPEGALVEVVGVRKGDVVAANQPIVRVLRADDLWVKAYVPETELGKLRQGQEVEVTCDSYPGKRFVGTVVQVASTSEYTPRNVQSADERRHQVFAIKVRVADPQGVFKSGMAADVIVSLH